MPGDQRWGEAMKLFFLSLIALFNLNATGASLEDWTGHYLSKASETETGLFDRFALSLTETDEGVELHYITMRHDGNEFPWYEDNLNSDYFFDGQIKKVTQDRLFLNLKVKRPTGLSILGVFLAGPFFKPESVTYTLRAELTKHSDGSITFKVGEPGLLWGLKNVWYECPLSLNLTDEDSYIILLNGGDLRHLTKEPDLNSGKCSEQIVD